MPKITPHPRWGINKNNIYINGLIFSMWAVLAFALAYTGLFAAWHQAQLAGSGGSLALGGVLVFSLHRSGAFLLILLSLLFWWPLLIRNWTARESLMAYLGASKMVAVLGVGLGTALWLDHRVSWLMWGGALLLMAAVMALGLQGRLRRSVSACAHPDQPIAQAASRWVVSWRGWRVHWLGLVAELGLLGGLWWLWWQSHFAGVTYRSVLLDLPMFPGQIPFASGQLLLATGLALPWSVQNWQTPDRLHQFKGAALVLMGMGFFVSGLFFSLAMALMAWTGQVLARLARAPTQQA
jgi:hypothetical protein